MAKVVIQVVIIGAGPAGLTLALLLAQRGISVKLIEASRSFRRIFRGEALMPSGLAAIEAMGLADVLQQIPHRSLDAWEFYIEKQFIFRVDEPMEAGGKPCTLISQPAFLEAIGQQAQTYSNFELIQGVAFQDLIWQDGLGDDRRVSGVQLSDGQTIAADLVIGADGRNSIVRERAGLKLQQTDQSFDILWFKLADETRSVIEQTPQLATENVFYSVLCDRDGFGCFQGSDGQFQVGWSLHKEDAEKLQSKPQSKSQSPSQLPSQPIDWAEKFAAASPDWLAQYFRNHAQTISPIDRPLLLSVLVGRCDRWSRPGLLLLGDAVHPMSPIRAQGINMALQDVVSAINHLVPYLNVDLDLDQDSSNNNAHDFPDYLKAIDSVLPLIQAEREPEIIRIQQLQQAEVAQGELLRKNPWLRSIVSRCAPILRYGIRKSWIDRQLKLRSRHGGI